jgi:hypothetical protein
MKISARSYLIAGVTAASTGLITLTPIVLPVTPYGTWIAGAQPADNNSSNGTDRPGTGARSTSPHAGASDKPTDVDNSSASAVAGQANRGSPSPISVVSGNGQASTGSAGVVGRLSSHVTTGTYGGTRPLRVTNDVQSFGASRNRVTVAANGFILPHAQVATTRSLTRVSATTASAADSAPTPSPGQTINAAVQRAMAGQASATAHASGSAGATVSTGQAPTGIPAAQPARSSSPYAGKHH